MKYQFDEKHNIFCVAQNIDNINDYLSDFWLGKHK